MKTFIVSSRLCGHFCKLPQIRLNVPTCTNFSNKRKQRSLCYLEAGGGPCRAQATNSPGIIKYTSELGRKGLEFPPALPLGYWEVPLLDQTSWFTSCLPPRLPASYNPGWGLVSCPGLSIPFCLHTQCPDNLYTRHEFNLFQPSVYIFVSGKIAPRFSFGGTPLAIKMAHDPANEHVLSLQLPWLVRGWTCDLSWSNESQPWDSENEVS